MRLKDIQKIDFTDCIVASMATFPERFKNLDKVINSIIQQVDYLFVYVNESNQLPTCLLNHPKIIAFLGQDEAGNLSANGKIYALKYVNNALFFTIDDDLIFPQNYVEMMLATLKKHQYQVGLTIHGSIFAPHLYWYYERSAFYGLRMALSENKLVTLIGSGGFCYHQKHLHCRFEDFMPDVRVDITFSTLAKQQKIPLLSIKRSKNWITPISNSGLWEQFRNHISHHTDYYFDNTPWDFGTYRDIVETRFSQIFDTLDTSLFKTLNFDSEVAHALLNHTFPASWRRSAYSFRGRRNYLRITAKQRTLKQRLYCLITKQTP